MTSDKPFSHLSVQIATPCHDAKYCREYVRAFTNTMMLLQHFGATTDWAELPFCSDIAMARSKIFSNFLRSQHTHLMMIDSDMGWEPNDVVRLLVADRDLVGGAGCKKVYPVGFAVNNSDENLKELPLLVEGTGLIEVTEVGMAFMLMSKKCAERMVAAYPDLQFDGDNGNIEYSVYDSMIVGSAPKRRRLSEDFAFCNRWRKIGGKIYLYPDIRLDHIGSHVWRGALTDVLGKPPNVA